MKLFHAIQIRTGIYSLVWQVSYETVYNEIDASFNLILSATMFDGLIYQVDTVHHVLNIDVPDTESTVRNLRIVDKDGRQFVLCNGIDAD